MTLLDHTVTIDALLDQINASPLGGWSVQIARCRTREDIAYLRREITGCDLKNPLHSQCLAALGERAGQLKREHYEEHVQTLVAL